MPSNFHFAIEPFPKKQVLSRLLAEFRVGLITESQVDRMSDNVRNLVEEGMRGCEARKLRKTREQREDQAVENMKREVKQAYMSNPEVEVEWPEFEHSTSDWDTSDYRRSVFFGESDDERRVSRLAVECSLIRHGGRILRDLDYGGMPRQATCGCVSDELCV